MTDKGQLTEEVKGIVKKAKKVVIVGGEGSVSKNIENTIANFDKQMEES